MKVRVIQKSNGYYVEYKNNMYGPMCKADAEQAKLKEYVTPAMMLDFLQVAKFDYETNQRQQEIA